jgi:hypothetical protein
MGRSMRIYKRRDRVRVAVNLMGDVDGFDWGVMGHSCAPHCGAFRDNAHGGIGEAPCVQHPSFRRGDCTAYCVKFNVGLMANPGEIHAPYARDV